MSESTLVRKQIKEVLESVKPGNAPRIYEAIQTENGYSVVEDMIINMMIDDSMTVSETIIHVEDRL